ncbi:MAG TPA: DUF5985 family protein [Longimicrobium sp.]|jgi:hypothetical protein|uniref:DUF5985 family protein n=1 Tax=Longimicrobium sp. TaxID=2029185 RepID=UPI002EDA4CA6
MGQTLTVLIAGALAAGYAVASLFFARFYRETRDRLFVMFSVAFLLLALQRVVLALVSDDPALLPWVYGLRLVAFVIILAAIIDKNRAG